MEGAGSLCSGNCLCWQSWAKEDTIVIKDGSNWDMKPQHDRRSTMNFTTKVLAKRMLKHSRTS